MKIPYTRKPLLILCTLPLLVAFQCDEDEYVPDNIVENDDLIKIEGNKNVFALNDCTFIQTKISNQQTTIDGRTLNLNDFIVGGELYLGNSFSLYRVSAENEQIPYFIQNVQMLDGTIEFNNENSFFYITSAYNASTDSFTSNIAIQLLESGNYVLKPDTFADKKYQVIYDLSGLATIGSVQLKTSILNADEEGVYRFSVE